MDAGPILLKATKILLGEQTFIKEIFWLPRLVEYLQHDKITCGLQQDKTTWVDLYEQPQYAIGI